MLLVIFSQAMVIKLKQTKNVLNYLSNNDSYRLSIIDVTNNEPSHFLRA